MATYKLGVKHERARIVKLVEGCDAALAKQMDDPNMYDDYGGHANSARYARAVLRDEVVRLKELISNIQGGK